MFKADELKNKSTEELTDIIHSLSSSLDENKKIIEDKQSVIQENNKIIAYLRETVYLLKHNRFGASSEKYIDNCLQGCLFDEASLPENSEAIEDAEESISVPAHTRKKPGRKPLPKDIPRQQVVYDLTDEEKTCACGSALHLIGDERSEQLDIIPAKIQVIEHVQRKYACKGCQSCIKVAKKTKQPIPKSIASPGLLAYVLTQKFQFHLPLYRQEQMLKALGIDILRATMSHWVIKCSQLLQPLVNLLQDDILDYNVAYADETTVQVLKEDNKKAQSKSYMWCYAGGKPDRFCYIYTYHPSRQYKIPIEFFSDFNGYLHCDGYQAYDDLAKKNPEVLLVGCWYHARRKFVETAKVSKKTGLSDWFIKQIRRFSHVEKTIKEEKQTSEEVFHYRLEHATPIMEKIKDKLDEQYDKVSPSSLLGKAIRYTLNQWGKLQNYLKDGRLDISNNRMEGAIKPFAVGRKNWMFANSVDGAKAAAIIFSLIETCKAHEVNPYDWLKDTLAKLPNCETVEQYEQLLPFKFPKLKSDSDQPGG